MDIKKAVVTNYKKIKYAELPFEKHLMLIQGKNASGKTSLIEAITSCLGGKNKDTKEPIRQGEKRANTTIHFEHDGVKGTLEQVFTPSGMSVKIVFEDGKEIRGVQKVAEFIGCSSFDPMAFSNMTEKEQRETLLKLSGTDLTKADEDIKEAEQDRLLAFRQKSNLQQIKEDELAEAMKLSEMDEVSVTKLTEELQDIQNETFEFTEKERKLNAMTTRNIQIDNKLEELTAMIDKLQDEQIQLQKDIELHKKDMQDNYDPGEDVNSRSEKIREQIQNAEQTNQNIRNAKEAIKKYNEYQEADKKHEEAEQLVKDKRQAKQDLLKDAKMPVKGLEVTDDGVKYNNVPFKQINTAEQILIGVKIALQDPENKLKFVFIERGSELDSESVQKLQELVDYCHKQGVKVNILVGQAKDSPQENGFFLEEGQIINN